MEKGNINQEKVAFLVAVMASVSFVIASVSIGILYFVFFEQLKLRLIETAQSQARLIEAIAKFDARFSTHDHPEGAFGATLSQIREAHKNYKGLGSTGEFTLARQEGDKIVFLLSHRHEGSFNSLHQDVQVTLSGKFAQPMQKALKGESGSMVGVDYRGAKVLAAFEPVHWSGYKIGIVAKIDVAEVQAPFMKAGLITGLFALCLIIFGAVVFKSVTKPLDQRLEENEEKSQLGKGVSSSGGSGTTKMKEKTSVQLILISIALAAGIFILDVSLPQGVAGAVPYVGLVLVSLWSPKQRFTLQVAIASTILAMTGFFLSPPGSGAMWVVLFNRFLALFAIWVTVVLSLHRKNMEEEREKLIEKLSTANAELSDFSHLVSHDLKAPLRAINNYAHFLQKDLMGDLKEEQKMYFRGIEEAVNKSDKYIDNILKLSLIGKQKITIKNVNPGKLLKELIRSLGLPSDIKIVMRDDWPSLGVEPTLFRQIFQNLISNAIKFNNSSQKVIEFGWHPKYNNSIEVFVRDNGIGIESGFFKKIFEPFQRLHSSDEYEGTGIGLAATMKAAGRLNWSVRVESKPGKGSTFFVTVPIL